MVCEWVFSLVVYPDKTQSEEEGRIGDGKESDKLTVRERSSNSHKCPLLCSEVETVADEKSNISQKRKSTEIKTPGTIAVCTECMTGGSTSSITHENHMQCGSEGDNNCNDDGVTLLMEMFPEVCEGRVRVALQNSIGDVEKTVQTLLEIAKENSEEQEAEIPLTRVNKITIKKSAIIFLDGFSFYLHISLLFSLIYSRHGHYRIKNWKMTNSLNKHC